MTKNDKDRFARHINTLIEPLGGTFRFRRTRDDSANGIFYPEKRLIVIKWTAGRWTLAHEIAHLEQYNDLGETRCNGHRLSGDHWEREQKWNAILRKDPVIAEYQDTLS